MDGMHFPLKKWAVRAIQTHIDTHYIEMMSMNHTSKCYKSLHSLSPWMFEISVYSYVPHVWLGTAFDPPFLKLPRYPLNY